MWCQETTKWNRHQSKITLQYCAWSIIVEYVCSTMLHFCEIYSILVLLVSQLSALDPVFMVNVGHLNSVTASMDGPANHVIQVMKWPWKRYQYSFWILFNIERLVLTRCTVKWEIFCCKNALATELSRKIWTQNISRGNNKNIRVYKDRIILYMKCIHDRLSPNIWAIWDAESMYCSEITCQKFWAPQ